MSEYRHLSPAEQKAYIKARNERIVTLNVSDPAIKEKIREAAKLDGRSINNWLRVHILPKIENVIATQVAAAKAKQD